jgi:hypothetical protein
MTYAVLIRVICSSIAYRWPGGIIIIIIISGGGDMIYPALF